jgi:YebC/PmpR family DNA-binding regulatory protein
MSGHNKWSKIKHKKASTDAKKSQVFSKLVKLIQSEARLSGGDKNSPGLRAAIEKARSENMPQANIERAISKASSLDTAQLEAITYEAYGPGGSAIIIECLTDNRNRTAAEIKHLLAKQGAVLATPGAAAWAFSKEDSVWKPNPPISISQQDLSALQEIVDSLTENDDVQAVFTNAVFS